MFKNYLLIAIRNLKKQKAFTLINVIGLAVGMAGFAIFALGAGVKLNADKFHKNADRIYGIVQVLSTENKDEQHSAFTPAPLLPSLIEEFPEFEDAVRIFRVGKGTLKHGTESFYENNILFVDSNFLTFFTFEMSAGDPETALSQPNSIVLSQAVAAKYFGEKNPIGEVLTLERNTKVTVTGVTKDVPRTSSIRFEFLVSMATAKSLFNLMDDWEISRHAAFIRLLPGVEKARLENQFPTFLQKYFANSPKSPKRMYLFPLLDFRLKASHITSIIPSSNFASVVINLFIGVLLLVVVCINFINLSTARYMYRAKEIGTRKVIGARRYQLIAQFLSESLMLAFLALPIAITLFEFIYPMVRTYVGPPPIASYVTSTPKSIWHYPFLLKYLLGTSLFVGIVSGLYPAFFLSSFKPVQILTGSIRTGRKKRAGSQIMIVLQFTLSIIFIGFAGAVQDQFDHLLGADFGYNKKQIAAVSLSDIPQSSREILKTEISRNPAVLSVSASENLPYLWISKRSAIPPGLEKENAVSVQAYGVDYNFIEMLEIEMLRGRSFSQKHGDGNSFILNEAAVKKLQLKEAIGEQITLGEKTGTVVGVANDFLFGDIGFEIPPAVLYLEKEELGFLLIKFSSSTPFKDLHNHLKKQWQIIVPDFPFDCISLDDYFLEKFGFINKLAGFFNLIGVAAVFFSCLGLLGLASYVVERRTKEIGIRKVLGASLLRVLWTISKEFIRLVVYANILGLAIIFIAWKGILQTGILYMIDIGAGTYFFVIVISLLTAIVAVTSQIVKAALANPVEALRYE